MKYALQLGKIAGIKISVHWTFLLLIGWIVWRESRRGSSTDEILWTILFVLTIFLCVTLHELGHALTAKRFHIKTLDITLLPIGGLARLETMPEKPAQELWVAIAGPLVNIAIAILLFPVIMNQLNMEFISSMKGIGKETFLLNLFSVNIMLAFFNLLPAFPMDGGRVFRALLSFRLHRHVATRIAASVGQLLAVLFVVGGFFVNPFLIFIGLFIFMGAQAEAEMTANKFVLSGYKVNDVRMSNYITVNAADTLAVPVTLLLDGQTKNFIVLNGDNIAGTLSRDELVKGLSEKGKEAQVADVMNKEVVFLDADMPLENAYQLMQQHARNLLPVMKNNHLAGALDLENILEFIMVKSAMKDN
jgi:Zn-dependent protease/CBS domain-containing protein